MCTYCIYVYILVCTVTCEDQWRKASILSIILMDYGTFTIFLVDYQPTNPRDLLVSGHPGVPSVVSHVWIFVMVGIWTQVLNLVPKYYLLCAAFPTQFCSVFKINCISWWILKYESSTYNLTVKLWSFIQSACICWANAMNYIFFLKLRV